MTETYKVLGRFAPSDTSENLLYTVPSNTSAIITNITVVNRGGTTGTFSIRSTEGTLGNNSYLYKSAQISANTSEILETGITLAAGGKIYVTGTSSFTFSVYGIELSETGKYKTLGQIAPSAATWTVGYTVASGKSSLIRSINISNIGASTETFDIAIVDASGDAPGNSHYITYSEPILAGETITIKAGFTLASGNTIKAKSTNGNAAFSIFGAEI